MYPVVCDGQFMGYIPIKLASLMERRLRLAKVDAKDVRVPYLSEVYGFPFFLVCF